MKGHNIFTKIFQEHADNFILSFKNSKKLFYSPTRKNRLYHPSEFGIYREKIVKDFIRLFVPYRLDISSGFIINIEDNPSPQADLVIYDRNETPIIKTNEGQSFFPIETVVSVGEVKSDLSESNLQKALEKLVLMKKLRETIKEALILYTRRPRFVEKNDFNAFVTKDFIFSPETIWTDQISTFIICNKLNFSFDKNDIGSWLNNLYPKNTSPRHKVDFILSLEDGFIGYYDERSNVFAIHSNFELNEQIPDLKLNILVPTINKYMPLAQFASNLNNRLSFTTIVKPEIQTYLKELEKIEN